MSMKFTAAPRWLSQAIRFPSSVAKKTPTPSQALFMSNARSSMSTFTSSPAQKFSLQNRQLPGRLGSRSNLTRNPPSPLQRLTFRRFNSSRANEQARPKQSGSLSQRLKKLSREYGWAALGVYLLLSAMDFPFCFIAVRHLGAERIGRYEDAVVESVKGLFGMKTEPEETSEEEAPAAQSEDQKKNNNGASLWTQIALAYAIHKSLIFIRVPLTAVITPKVVKVLRVWGWDLAKGKPRGM